MSPEKAMESDEPSTERSMTASIAVFLFAIARHWREVRASDGTRIPNHLFSSTRAGAFLMEGGPPEHLRKEWNIPPGGVHLGPTKDTIEDVIAYLGLSTADIQFLERYYRLTGGMRAFSLFGDHRKFKRPPHPMHATPTPRPSTNCSISTPTRSYRSTRATNSFSEKAIVQPDAGLSMSSNSQRAFSCARTTST